jgi:hypothetical protein
LAVHAWRQLTLLVSELKAFPPSNPQVETRIFTAFVVMIENYRSGLAWKLFMSNAEIKPALDGIGIQPDLGVKVPRVNKPQNSVTENSQPA